MFVFPSNLSVLIKLKKRWIYSLCCICMCVYRKSNNNNTWFRIIKASKQKKCGFEVERFRDDIIYTHEKNLMSEIQQHLNCKLSTISSIVCRNFSLWGYPLKTSAYFYDFWSLTPSRPKKCRRRKWMVPI